MVSANLKKIVESSFNYGMNKVLEHVFMFGFIGKSNDIDLDPVNESFLKRTSLFDLGIWFSLEVVLGYWWCFVTQHDPITEHTHFVLIFVCFNIAQFLSLKKLGVFGSTDSNP